MIFIVESGSTKSDWVLVDNKNNQNHFSTLGFNPYFHSADWIEGELRKNEGIMAISDQVKEVYFYGAGCSSEKLNAIVQVGLNRIFSNAKINIDHDLVACAYATYKGKDCIACIIGTGSNSCFFDGQSVTEVLPALGYILGDEGSGSYFGKKLIAAFLYHHLPEHLTKDFIDTYGLNKDALIEKVYCEPNANVFIASFMPFIAKHSQEPFFQHMIEDGFRHFIQVHVCCYPNCKTAELWFVGSIADVFKEALDRAAHSLGLIVTGVCKKPVEGLVDYHLKYVLDRNDIIN